MARAYDLIAGLVGDYVLGDRAYDADGLYGAILKVFVRSRRDEGPQGLTEDHDLTG